MIWLVLLSAAFVVPFWRLLPDYGMNRYWALTTIFPLCALVLLYFMAFGPARQGDRNR